MRHRIGIGNLTEHKDRLANSSIIETLSQIDLIKYQALGNDYLMLDLPGPLDELVTLLPVLCDRFRGIGSDGLLAFDPRAMSVRIFNPDGSEAQKSGNGLCITAAHAVLEHGAGERFELRTMDRANAVKVLARDGAQVTSEIDIGRPSFRAADLPARFEGEPDQVTLETPAGTVTAVLVSVGNPHCVVFGEPVTRERCLELGPHIERHPEKLRRKAQLSRDRPRLPWRRRVSRQRAGIACGCARSRTCPAARRSMAWRRSSAVAGEETDDEQTR